MQRLSQPPQFSDYLFWDVDQTKMDSDKYRSFVIRRVFEIGTLDDLIESLVFYGKDAVKETLVSAESLSDNAVDLAAALFHLRPADFACYNSKQYPATYER